MYIYINLYRIVCIIVSCRLCRDLFIVTVCLSITQTPCDSTCNFHNPDFILLVLQICVLLKAPSLGNRGAGSVKVSIVCLCVRVVCMVLVICI